MRIRRPKAYPTANRPRPRDLPVVASGAALLLGWRVAALLGGFAVPVPAKDRLPGAAVPSPAVGDAAPDDETDAVESDRLFGPALARCEEERAQARERVRERGPEGGALLRLGSMELFHAQLLAMRAYNRLGPEPGEDPQGEARARTAWRERFLLADPGGDVTRAKQAVEAALHAGLGAHCCFRALHLLATARESLGDPAGAIAALSEATRLQPDDSWTWTSLSNLCARSRQFRRAEKARGHALRLLAKPS